MTWWESVLAVLSLLWLFYTLSHISEKAEQAAKDAAMLRYKLEELTTWLERNTEVQMTRQKTTLSRLHWIREHLGWQPPTDDDSLV